MNEEKKQYCGFCEEETEFVADNSGRLYCTVCGMYKEDELTVDNQK